MKLSYKPFSKEEMEALFRPNRIPDVVVFNVARTLESKSEFRQELERLCPEQRFYLTFTSTDKSKYTAFIKCLDDKWNPIMLSRINGLYFHNKRMKARLNIKPNTDQNQHINNNYQQHHTNSKTLSQEPKTVFAYSSLPYDITPAETDSTHKTGRFRKLIHHLKKFQQKVVSKEKAVEQIKEINKTEITEAISSQAVKDKTTQTEPNELDKATKPVSNSIGTQTALVKSGIRSDVKHEKFSTSSSTSKCSICLCANFLGYGDGHVLIPCAQICCIACLAQLTKPVCAICKKI